MTKGYDKEKAVEVTLDCLKVVMCEDDGFWFAQGLEIDYAAYGKTVKDAKYYFEEGLVATINEHLNMFGNLDNFLKPAPKEEWNAVYSKAFSLSGKSVHFIGDNSPELSALGDNFPFSAIAYSETSCAA